MKNNFIVLKNQLQAVNNRGFYLKISKWFLRDFNNAVQNHTNIATASFKIL